MADIAITDQLDKPVESVKVDLAQPSSLVKYLQTQLLHLAVVPDFLARKDLVLSEAATKPTQYHAEAKHAFQLGGTQPEIDITPGAQVTIGAEAGKLSVTFQGSLGLGVSGSAGQLTFGFDTNTVATLEYQKAFPVGAGEPTLLSALSQTLADFVIPADVSDLEALGVGDVATVSGQGSLKVSGGLSMTVSPNPLASVDLPLGVGTIAVKAGGTVAVSASFAISGSYQVQARRKDADTIALSVLREHGTAMTYDVSASAGITAGIGSMDLAAVVMGAISTDPTKDQSLLGDLTPAEIQTLTAAIKSGADHNLRASIDAALSASSDDQAVFQYEIRPASLGADSRAAVQQALRGDLSALTAMDDVGGVTMLSSILTQTQKRGLTMKINLLGIVNLLTVSELIRKCEVLTDAVSGDVTIKETVTGNRIGAEMDPLLRNEALRKALFDSVLVTTCYRAGKTVTLADLSCEHMHFALNQNTNHQIVSDYLRWFVALNLLSTAEPAAILAGFSDGGPSTCVLRTTFGDADCEAMFLDAGGNPRPKSDYLEVGRRAMRALLDPEHQEIDKLRFPIVDDALWPTAAGIGAAPDLGPLVGLSTADVRVEFLIGDMVVITDWADGMSAVGALIQAARQSGGTADARGALQKRLAEMVKKSKTRFDEPWGMVCLFWAGGSPRSAYGKAATQKLIVERGKTAVQSQASATGV
jgi:hypothetical protein